MEVVADARNWRFGDSRWSHACRGYSCQAAQVPLADACWSIDHADAGLSARSAIVDALGRLDKVLADRVNDKLARLADMSTRILDFARPASARVSKATVAELTWS